MTTVPNRFVVGVSIVGIILCLGPVRAQITKSPGTKRIVPTTFESPEALVRSLYKRHDEGHSMIFDKQSRKTLDLYFDPHLAGLLWKNIKGLPRGDLANLDFDPLYNAQDVRISNFRIASVRTPKSDPHRLVVVTFRNYEEPNRILFHLRKVGSAWKIQDLDYGSGQRLVTILSQPF